MVMAKNQDEPWEELVDRLSKVEHSEIDQSLVAAYIKAGVMAAGAEFYDSFYGYPGKDFFSVVADELWVRLEEWRDEQQEKDDEEEKKEPTKK
jgi:hypothetical protein